MRRNTALPSINAIIKHPKSYFVNVGENFCVLGSWGWHSSLGIRLGKMLRENETFNFILKFECQ